MMITSKAQTTGLQENCAGPVLREVDEIAFDEKIGNPFHMFTEWDGEADQAAYADPQEFA